jgi:hypothetical protein
VSGDGVKRKLHGVAGAIKHSKPAEQLKELGLPTPKAKKWGPEPQFAPGRWGPHAVPLRMPEPPPPAPKEVIGGVGVSSKEDTAEAGAELKRTLALMTTNPAIARKLQDAKVSVVVIPANQKMTDVPELASLKGKSTFDGRPWDDVRGEGGMRMRDGSFVVGVAEETLTHAPPDTYPKGYNLAMHEIAHVVQDLAINKDDAKAVTRAFKDRTNEGGPWTDPYASNNEREYFAQATVCYFGEDQGQGANGADWLQQNDPAMYAVLQRVYGPPPATSPAPPKS